MLAKKRLLICVGLGLVCAVFSAGYLLRHYYGPLLAMLTVFTRWHASPPGILHIPPTELLYSDHLPQSNSIPRIFHHVLLGPMGQHPPAEWVEARRSCLDMHPHFTSHLWTDDTAMDFLTQNYPHIVPTYTSYPSIVQRADALRYVIMYHYGGVFLDMDLVCIASLDPLVAILEEKQAQMQTNSTIMAVQAKPVGVSNGFIIATQRHPVLEYAMENLPSYNLNFGVSYATVMFSTGCMYLSAAMMRMRHEAGVWVLGGRENMLSGRKRTVLFLHLGSSSWHTQDAKFMRWVAFVVGRRMGALMLGMAMGLGVGAWLWRRRRTVRAALYQKYTV